MEHSYLGNKFMRVVEWLLSPEGYFHKSAIVWAGDYADPEEDGQNLYYHCNEMEDRQITPEPKNFNAEDYPYLVNHTRKEYVKKALHGSHTPHPLSILTAEGNGAGGGDYRGHDEDHAGRWAREILSVEREVPDDYTELEVLFKED
jgi:hypothetical protein